MSLWNTEALNSQMLDYLMDSFQSLLLCPAALNRDSELRRPCFGDCVDFHLSRLFGLSTSQRSPANSTLAVKTIVTMAVTAAHVAFLIWLSPDNLQQLLDTSYCPRQTSVATNGPVQPIAVFTRLRKKKYIPHLISNAPLWQKENCLETLVVGGSCS